MFAKFVQSYGILTQNIKKQFDFLIKIKDSFIEGKDYIFHIKGKKFIGGTKVL